MTDRRDRPRCRFANASPALLLWLLACSGGESTPTPPGGAGTGGGAPAAGAPSTGGAGGTAGAEPVAGAPSAGGGSGGAGGSSGGGTGGAVAGAGGSTGGSAGAGGAGAGQSGAGGSGDAGAGAGMAGSAGSAGTGASGGSAGAITGTPTEDALEPLPAVRQEHAVVAAAGEIYVIGGYVMNGISTSVIAYDPTADSWRDVQAFPGPMQHPNAGVVNDKIYVAGFYMTTGTTSTSSQVFEYDPTMDEWAEREPMPLDTGRAAGCVAVDGGLMYVLGGAIDGTSVDYAARYDPMADEWETLPALPGAREHCGAAAVNGTIYFAGGRVDEIVNIEADVWAFEPGGTSWTPVAPMLRPRAGFAAAVLGGRLYTFGGEGNPDTGTNGIFRDIDVYDPVADEWEALAPMVIPRHGFGAATLGDRIYLAGGAIRQGGAASAENSVFYLE